MEQCIGLPFKEFPGTEAAVARASSSPNYCRGVKQGQIRPGVGYFHKQQICSEMAACVDACSELVYCAVNYHAVSPNSINFSVDVPHVENNNWDMKQCKKISNNLMSLY